MSYFYVIDDSSFLPSEGYARIPLSHEQAVEELRGKSWFWYIENKEAETFHRLQSLAKDSGVPLDGDNLEQRRLKSPERLSMGQRFLLIYDHHKHDEDNRPMLSYHLFHEA